MTKTPQERVRASIVLTVSIELAERMLQADKANPAFTLADLKDDNERAIYIEEAVAVLLDPCGRTRRIARLNGLRAHSHAIVEDENERIAARARRDIERYGQAASVESNFGTVRPGLCWICRQRVGPQTGAVLHITDSLVHDVHDSCAINDDRCVAISKISYRLKAARS